MVLALIFDLLGTTFFALSLRAEGYSVFANVEASGTTSQLIADTANLRMQQAGVQLVSLFSIVGDLMRDWRNAPGALEVFPWLAQSVLPSSHVLFFFARIIVGLIYFFFFYSRYLPIYGILAQGHIAAVENGTIVPGEDLLISS